MISKKKKRPPKKWDWSYVFEGKPETIMYGDYHVLHLKDPTSLAQVRRVLRLLNKAEKKR